MTYKYTELAEREMHACVFVSVHVHYVCVKKKYVKNINMVTLKHKSQN